MSLPYRNPNHLLPYLNPDWFYLSGTGLPSSSWNRGRQTGVVVIAVAAAQTVLGVYLKRTCSRVTIASSALGVLNDYALCKSTHTLTDPVASSGCVAALPVATDVTGSVVSVGLTMCCAERMNLEL